MKLIPLKAATIGGVMLLSAAMLSAGPNKDASIIIDQNADTEELEQQCVNDGVGTKVAIGVMIENATELTGFLTRLRYDNTVLKFERATTVMPGSDETSFLESNGGVSGPFLAAPVADNEIDIAAAVKSSDGVAVAGNGLLAYVAFSRITNQECAITLAKAELSNQEHKVDKLITEYSEESRDE